MLIEGKTMRTIWPDEAGRGVRIIDQTVLPHKVATLLLENCEAARRAIADMQVRGAPLIGVCAAYGLALAMRDDASDQGLERASALLAGARPTAVNLQWALNQMRLALEPLPPAARQQAAFAKAAALADADVACNEAIGRHGAQIIKALAAKKAGAPVNILTHCNAGWLATVDWGTALAPIYRAHADGVALKVFVDETRPRNQGAALTAFELGQQGVPHVLIVDNAGGHLMQRGEIDMTIVGADRIGADGGVCNKIGTYLKALACADNDTPFYVAAPSSTIDFSISDSLAQIPIEERDAREVTHIAGLEENGALARVEIAPRGVQARNPAFDVTPGRLVTGIVTERGLVEASARALASAFPDLCGAR